NADALVAFPFSSSGMAAMPDHIANSNEIGATYGLAYHRGSQELFSAAFLKQFMGFGSQGEGGIYVTDFSNSPPTNSNFINLNTLGFGAGNIGNRNLPANFGGTSRDSIAFEMIGKASLGDLDISTEGNDLYTVNLTNRNLIRINISNYISNGTLPNAANITSFPIPNPNCSNGDYRPFAIKYHNNRVYIGVVCSAETSQLRTDLAANVYEFNPATGSFSNVLSFSLDYIKGALTSFPIGNNCERWEPWTDDFNDFYYTNLPNGVCYPQAILADIEFDVDGSMILGFMDRAGHQLSRNNLSPITGDNMLRTGTAGGELLRAYNNNGTFVIENNGVAGPLTGCGSAANGGGLGGLEFYCGDSGAGGEKEGAMGGLALLPGSGMITQALLNPFTTNSGGIAWLSNNDGNVVRRYQLYTDGPQFLGKAHGLGDLELLCDLPSIEIGNRVWADNNANGVQDANEPGIVGVVVQLFNGAGALVASTMTNSNGEYYFNEINVPGGINPNATYYLSVSSMQFNPTGGLTINATNYGGITNANQGTGGQPDLIDSDAIQDANSGSGVINAFNLPYITVTTGNMGTVDHSFDFGFGEVTCNHEVISVTPSVTTVCSGAELTLTIQHTDNIGDLSIFYNVGSILTPSELYEVGNGGATALQQDISSTGTTTTITITMPENTTDSPFPYNIYAVLDANNPLIDPNCLPQAVTMIVVNPSPTATASGNSVCEGETIFLMASGGGTYQWSGPGGYTSTQQNPVITNPDYMDQGTYYVTVTNALGCTDEESVVVLVTDFQATITPNQTICEGQSATVTASSGVTYQWNNNATTSSIVVNPTSTTTYTVTVTGTQGCTDIVQSTITVGSANANTSPNQSICLGESTTLTATGGGNYA
ncbi:MAG: SdrD B-like domain-containing protein, partial [Chitinophagales bacterium]